MPPRLTYPGVYVQEQASGARAITGVATSTGLFVGMARKGQLGRPTAVRSADQYDQIFGDDPNYGEMAVQVRQFFLNGGAEAVIVRGADAGAAEATVTLLREAGGQGSLLLTAKDAGTLGAEIRAVVDY
ncbi:MAG: phage tail sheath family protein, partial [Pseudomonadota bacterium]